MRLKSPHKLATRPTTNLVRGALFSMLASLGAKLDRVLDLFAGTGALGIEALSRGANQIDFVEQNSRACALIRENIGQVDGSGLSHVYCTSVGKALQFLSGPYDLVLMDPPYASPELATLMANPSLSRSLAPGGFLVVLHSSRTEIRPADASLTMVKERKHGDTSLSIFEKEGAA